MSVEWRAQLRTVYLRSLRGEFGVPRSTELVLDILEGFCVSLANDPSFLEEFKLADANWPPLCPRCFNPVAAAGADCAACERAGRSATAGS